MDAALAPALLPDLHPDLILLGHAAMFRSSVTTQLLVGPELQSTVLTFESLLELPGCWVETYLVPNLCQKYG